MDFRNDCRGFSRPAAMFKTLRRLHGHNLENQGLNDLSEAFQNFVTRAKFFSIGRLRRTWSHSAVEFMKYRRLLPMLTSNGMQGDQFDVLDDASLSDQMGWLTERNDSFRSESVTSGSKAPAARAKGEEKKVIVTNISPRVTTSQLMAFFSKFGKISTCHIPSEDRRQSMFATLPKNNRSTLVAYITFRKAEGAEKAKNAKSEELKFYDKIMVVTSYGSVKKRPAGSSVPDDAGIVIAMGARGSMDEDCLSQTSSSMSLASSATFSLSDVVSLFGSRVTITNLPEKVLQLIFSMLPALDRIRIERVNKAFLESAVKSWSLSDSLSFANDSYVNRTFTQSNPMRNSYLKAFLSRCGIHLKKLDLSGIVHLFDDVTFEIISTYCPNLEEVNISGLTGHWKAFRGFSESLPHLSSVTYRSAAHAGEKSIWYLFRGNGANMTKVDLRGCKRIRGRFLRLLGTYLQELLLDGCSRIDNMAIEDLCVCSPNVKNLRLSGCTQISDESISLISRTMLDLQSFALCGDRFDNITSAGLIPLSRLSSLSHLWLDYNSAVSNEVLEAFINNVPQLRTLSIAYAGTDSTLTEDALIKIAQLKSLETLDLSSLAAVTNKVLCEVASSCNELRTVRVRSCTYLGEKGVCALQQLNNLEHLDLSGCLLVTTKAIQTLMDAFPAENKAPSKDKDKNLIHAVTVVIGGTICNISSLRIKGSRLVVDPSDYSALSSNTARDVLTSQAGKLGLSSDDEISEDEFESLSLHRAFIIDALHGEEDDSPDNDKSLQEWAEKEALHLGLVQR